LNMFFPFSSVSNQTYLLRKNRYQLTVFDRLNSYENLNEVCQPTVLFFYLNTRIFILLVLIIKLLTMLTIKNILPFDQDSNQLVICV